MPDQPEPLPAWFMTAADQFMTSIVQAALTASCDEADGIRHDALRAFLDAGITADTDTPGLYLHILWDAVASFTEHLAPSPDAAFAAVRFWDERGNQVDPRGPGLSDELAGTIGAVQFLAAHRNGDHYLARDLFLSLSPHGDEDDRWVWATIQMMTTCGDQIAAALIAKPDCPEESRQAWEAKQAHAREHHAPPPVVAAEVAVRGGQVWSTRA